MSVTLDVKDVRTTRYADMSRRPMDLGFVLGEKRITNNHIQPLKQCNPKRSVHEEIAKCDTGADVLRASGRLGADAV